MIRFPLTRDTVGFAESMSQGHVLVIGGEILEDDPASVQVATPEQD